MNYETNDNTDDEFNEYELYKLDKMSIDEKKWCKREFESELKNIYDIKTRMLWIVYMKTK